MVEVSASGDLTMDIVHSISKPRRSESPIDVEGKSLHVWKKIDGEWKCVVNSWNNNK